MIHDPTGETSYDGTGDAQVPDLARHWDASSVLGEREVAAAWCERAAVLADRQLAWEEAARLFERALALGGAGIRPAATPSGPRTAWCPTG